MDTSGQTYFEDEDRIPQADLDRMRDAERLELARRVQHEKEGRLMEELRRALGEGRVTHDPKALARIENVGSETYGSGVPE